MICEYVVSACRVPVQRAVDAAYVGTGVAFHVMAPWIFRGAAWTTAAQVAFDVTRPFSGVGRTASTVFLPSVVVDLSLAVTCLFLARGCARFSRAARADPWLHADPTYHVDPSRGLVAGLFTVILLIWSVALPSTAVAAWVAYRFPRILEDPRGLSVYASILLSDLGLSLAMAGILVAGCVRCRKARGGRVAREGIPHGATVGP